MFGQFYSGVTTVMGVPLIGTLTGYSIIDLSDATFVDTFRLAEQRDVDGDVARITAWDHQRTLSLVFYPTFADMSLVDLPVPGSRVVIGARIGPPSPTVLHGDYNYVGPGSLHYSHTGLAVMSLVIRRYNPLYGKTITP